MKYTLKNAKEFGWEGLKGFAYNDKNEFSNASGAYFEVTGSHGKVKTTTSDRVYYIIDGSGEFIINDGVVSVSKTDVVIVPKNTSYDYRASGGQVLKMFLVHTPAYDSEGDIKL